MAIAPTFQRYLDQKVIYDVIAHEPTMSSMRTAQACHVPGDCLAKGVLLRDDTGYMLAVLPATHYVRMHDLRLQFGRDVEFASEGEIDELFQDCAHGAVPPIGECYGLDTIVDEEIDGKGDVYLEAGDHITLVHLSHAQFAKLTADARHGSSERSPVL
jgi:Ala-tRNA(Pro) deacylase